MNCYIFYSYIRDLLSDVIWPGVKNIWLLSFHVKKSDFCLLQSNHGYTKRYRKWSLLVSVTIKHLTATVSGPRLAQPVCCISFCQSVKIVQVVVNWYLLLSRHTKSSWVQLSSNNTCLCDIHCTVLNKQSYCLNNYKIIHICKCNTCEQCDYAIHLLGVYGGFSRSESGQPSTEPCTKLAGSFMSCVDLIVDNKCPQRHKHYLWTVTHVCVCVHILTIHRPSTGTLEWKSLMLSSHHSLVSGLVKSGKAVGPGQTCIHRMWQPHRVKNAKSTVHRSHIHRKNRSNLPYQDLSCSVFYKNISLKSIIKGWVSSRGAGAADPRVLKHKARVPAAGEIFAALYWKNIGNSCFWF